ncbi:hypothetical protein ABEB36_012628 [Hypothenemus hampei]|uniref:RING-type domain-containing protein n=1 Tax=Hypothenemus hampei TaxID=57062 RepID=A0ABD1EC45_HYPHA
MNVERNRLDTFAEWPPDAAVSPQRIAKAGFFFTKQGLEVECFSCALRISNWTYGDQVMARHRTLSPECSFIVNPTGSGNVSLASEVQSQRTTINYQSEQVRLASFENWPIPEIVSPEDLARAGFYSLRIGDNTKCAFCKGVVRAWEPNDIPDVEHKRHFPTCPYVISTINPRLENRESSSSSRNSNGPTLQGNMNIIDNVVDGNLDELGVQIHNGPKRPDFGTVEARLKSFGTWSPYLIQTPNSLAQAGFYYEGLGDQVRCFHCDGGLRHWDPDDDPWTEHARWFSRCSFVNLVKGQEFVAACSLDSLDVNNHQMQKIKTAKKKRPVSDEELRAHLHSEAALAALEIGIDVQRVRRAMKQKLESTGEGYTQPDALVEAALNVQLEEDNDDDFESNTRSNYPQNNLTQEIKTDDSNGDRIVDSTSMTQNPSQHKADKKTDVIPGDHMEKSLSLEEENRLLKEARQCKICMDAEVGIVFLPCGHLTTCVNCAPNLEDCPVCRSAIKATVRTFLS